MRTKMKMKLKIFASHALEPMTWNVSVAVNRVSFCLRSLSEGVEMSYGCSELGVTVKATICYCTGFLLPASRPRALLLPYNKN